MTATNVDVSSSRIVRCAIAACLAAALLAASAASAVTDAHAALKYKQPACGKLQKQARKSTGAKKRSAKAKLKQCKANAAVYRQVRDSHFYGERADGVQVDTLYCANGRWQTDVDDGGEVRASGWRVVDARVRKGGKSFTAILEAWLPGGKHVQGVIRDGDAWQVGWEFSGKINDAGPVEKRDARGACANITASFESK